MARCCAFKGQSSQVSLAEHFLRMSGMYLHFFKHVVKRIFSSGLTALTFSPFSCVCFSVAWLHSVWMLIKWVLQPAAFNSFAIFVSVLAGFTHSQLLLCFFFQRSFVDSLASPVCLPACGLPSATCGDNTLHLTLVSFALRVLKLPSSLHVTLFACPFFKCSKCQK